jgi:hypothetical protein
MSNPASLLTGRRTASVLWFPVLFAIALPVIFELAFHSPQPHEVPIAVVGSPRQVEFVVNELRAVSSGGFDVEHMPSRAAASAAVRNRQVTAAYVDARASSPELYVARAASAIRANYLQGVFAQIAAKTRTSPPELVDLVPLLPGDSGTGIFFFVFPLMMVGVIAVLVLLQRAPTWSIERRAVAVVAVGVVGATTAYITVNLLDVLPNKPVLFLYGFLISQVFGQLLLGSASLLRQYFLPVALTFALVLSVPTAGATAVPDLLPTGLRYLSDVFPLAQGVMITRSVAYFDGADILIPTLILASWAAVACVVLGIAWYSQENRSREPALVAAGAEASSRVLPLRSATPG